MVVIHRELQSAVDALDAIDRQRARDGVLGPCPVANGHWRGCLRALLEMAARRIHYFVLGEREVVLLLCRKCSRSSV